MQLLVSLVEGFKLAGTLLSFFIYCLISLVFLAMFSTHLLRGCIGLEMFWARRGRFCTSNAIEAARVQGKRTAARIVFVGNRSKNDN
jgi:hypothetical protein